MIRRISLIEPKSGHFSIFSLYALPRLGIVLLATILREKGYQAEAVFLANQDLFLRRTDVDLVGISAITPTARASYEAADFFRTRGVPVVMGGPHVTFLPEESLAHADFCIAGEGEAALPMLVDALNHGGSLEAVPGLIWREGGTVRKNPTAEAVADLDTLPFPDFGLLDMGPRKWLGDANGRRCSVPVQTSRGCPYDCTFCSVTPMFGRRYRHRSVEHVVAELARFDPERQEIFFYDDNFAADPRKTKELLREMIRLRLGFRWSTQVRTDVVRDPELLDLAVQAGCKALYVGFESVNPNALAEMRKRQTVEDIRHSIREIRRRGIHLHGMFVFGFESDSPQTADATVTFALRERIDSAQFLILTPLPGSPLYTTLAHEGRLLDAEWDTYDGHHVKFLPRGFTPAGLQAAQIRAHSRFYSPFHVASRLLRGRILAFLVGVYAFALNRRWQREERGYLLGLAGVPASRGRIGAEAPVRPGREPRSAAFGTLEKVR
jgi:radical SAM superfamily enzyme YgiQ (UPF0313 family)